MIFDRTQLIILIACVILLAVLSGWILRWLFDRLNTTRPLASDDAMSRLMEAEKKLEAREKEFAETQAQYASAYSQLEAELEAAMAGLRDARREAIEMRVKAEGK